MKHIYTSHQLAEALLQAPSMDVYIADQYSESTDVNEGIYDDSVGYAPLAGIEIREHSSFWDDSTYTQMVIVPETREGY